MKKKWLICLMIGTFMIGATASYGSDNVRIAVASEGKTVSASVSSRAARCQYYLVFDGQGKLTEVLDNPYKDAAGGAGSSTAAFLADENVSIVIAETFGDKMVNAMRNKGLAYYQHKGTASEAVKKVLSNLK